MVSFAGGEIHRHTGNFMKMYIFHGTMGTPSGNWFPWLAQQGTSLGLEVATPLLPTPQGQTLDGWLSAFTAQCGDTDKDSIFVGHSIGAVFCLRLLERLSHGVRGSVLVAPPHQNLGLAEYDGLNASFVEGSFQWRDIKERAGELSLMVSDNDPYVPQGHFSFYARGLGVTPTVIAGGGHLNAESGHLTLPPILSFVERVLDAS